MSQPLILASTSPRRQEILKNLGVVFEIVSPPFEEIIDESLPAEIIVADLAFGKARSVLPQYQHRTILAADTVVAFEHRKLGKPKNKEELTSWLTMFSAKSCQVLTGHALFQNNRWLVEVYSADIQFAQLSATDIQNYVNDPEPDWIDKAGGFAVQGKASLFTSVQGQYSTVLGLSEEFVKRVILNQ